MKIPWLYALLMVCAATLVWPQAPASQGDVAQTLRRDDLVREAIAKSPAAASALHTMEAMKHRVPQAMALPDPSVSIGWMGNPEPFRIMSGDASSNRGLTVSEQFPYPGKLKLQGAIAGKDVEAAQVAYETICRRIAAEARADYYDLYYAQKALEIIEQNRKLLDSLEQIAEAQYRAGKATQSDVLQAQVQSSLLTEKSLMLEQQRSAAEARINALLQRGPELPLPALEELQLPALNELPQEELPVPIDAIYAAGAANDAEALSALKQIERGRMVTALAERQLRPDIGVSYSLQQRADQSTMNGVTVSVNLPIFSRSKQRQAIAEATENTIAAEKMHAERMNQVRLEIRQQYLAAQTAQRLMSLYKQGLIPQTALALESSMASYRVGKTEMQQVIANITAQLDYETSAVRQLADYETALARIESLTGVSLQELNSNATSHDAPVQEKQQ